MNRAKLLKAKFVTMKKYLWIYLNPEYEYDLPREIREAYGNSFCFLCELFECSCGLDCKGCLYPCSVHNIKKCPLEIAGHQCDIENSFYDMSLSTDPETRKKGCWGIFKICRDWEV